MNPFGLRSVSQDVFNINKLANAGAAVPSSHQMNIVEELCDEIFSFTRAERLQGDLHH